MNIKNMLLVMANDSWLTSANTSYTTSWSTRYLTDLYTAYSASRNTTRVTNYTVPVMGLKTDYRVTQYYKDSAGNWLPNANGAASGPYDVYTHFNSRMATISVRSTSHTTSYVTNYYSYKSLGSRYTSHITTATASRLTQWETE
ncbi:hypothetical protein [Campylobacter fetus]|uniref:hypothetical protein n=1 Tax=Campylobacter fetus TaxID=196 RepID=UPI0013D397BD|nr:hypothetical protein [Campylobacter fetus]